MKADGFRFPSFILSLADGTRLALCPGDEKAARVVAFLARAARLSPAPTTPPPGVRRLWVVSNIGRNAISTYIGSADATCILRRTDVALLRQVARLSARIAHETLPRGGVLLHSGLAAYKDPQGFGNPGGLEDGVLLAGRSGVGKTTACQRLPPPSAGHYGWRALADDVTLLVRDEAGAYWAHPWPTWSRFFGDKAGDGSDSVADGRTWDVQQAVPLRAIFCLEQGTEDRAEPLGPGHAVSLLAELARQPLVHFYRGRPSAQVAALNLQRFENLCALVRAVPAYTLHVSLGGTFWTEIERVMSQV